MSPFYQSNKGSPINGARPTPLRINKGSNVITKKPPSDPIIIYAQSPKVIHTRPQDFMALVQRLTGLSSSSTISRSRADDERGYYSSSGSDDQKILNVRDDDDDHIMSIKEETDIGSYLVSPTMFMAPKKDSIGDIPLYTPTGLDWLSSL